MGRKGVRDKVGGATNGKVLVFGGVDQLELTFRELWRMSWRLRWAMILTSSA